MVRASAMVAARYASLAICTVAAPTATGASGLRTCQQSRRASPRRRGRGRTNVRVNSNRGVESPAAKPTPLSAAMGTSLEELAAVTPAQWRPRRRSEDAATLYRHQPPAAHHSMEVGAAPKPPVSPTRPSVQSSP